MQIVDVTGFWTGEISGTNQGGLSMEIEQKGTAIHGIAKMHEPALGQYAYRVNGVVDVRTLSVNLVPAGNHSRLNLGLVKAVGTVHPNNSISGRWQSDIGTDGVFTLKRFDDSNVPNSLPNNNSIFIVHGHDEAAKHEVARFLAQVGVAPVILHEQVNRGMTILEKFENYASRAAFAVVLMTPDDNGHAVGKEAEKALRPRQNVVLELGYFVAKLGRSKTMVLTKGKLDLPSDIFGLIYESIEDKGWKLRLAQELKGAGFSIDLNKVLD